jgi:formylglycine-generating enzyme required for sulfatase activity
MMSEMKVRPSHITVLCLLLFALPVQASTFGRVNANLLPAPIGQDGLTLVAAMLQLAGERVAKFEGPIRLVPGAVPQDMVALPAGGFAMGSRTEEGQASEHPRHWVQLDAFALDRTEVSLAAYMACVNDKGCRPPTAIAAAPTPSDAQAVTGVTWHDAHDYCEKLGKRLPTEAEWEYAARSAGRDWTHPWGDQLATCQRAWITQAKSGCDKQQMASPCAIQAGASVEGVCDLIGGVWEWTADAYGAYRAEAAWNPAGPDHARARVVRGGSWLEFEMTSRSAARAPRLPGTVGADLGFRCAASLTEGPGTRAASRTVAIERAQETWAAGQPGEKKAGYIWIPGGPFHFGCEAKDTACFADEKPGQDVTIAGFWLAEKDATAADYQRCVDSGECGAADLGGSCNARVADRQDHPINCVSAWQAEVYCASIHARLPSAVEWESAAKGGEGRIYPWGDAVLDQTRANYCDKRCLELHPDWMWPDKNADDGWNSTSPVGLFPAGASKQGLLDMVGNAAQWTASAATLPSRDVRGGGWDLYARYLRNSARTALPPSHWFDNVTIRCAR